MFLHVAVSGFLKMERRLNGKLLFRIIGSQLRKELNVPNESIIFMDEMRLPFESHEKYVLDRQNVGRVFVEDEGKEKSGCSLLLTADGAGHWYPAFILFKGKKKMHVTTSPNVHAHFTESSWNTSKFMTASICLPYIDVHQNFEIGRAVQQECRDRSRMPSSA
eukprot:TRINITY_DN20840_c0_g2_i1.p1 TRINITY_DN20840_c0_g2~~TRINITY_DN20840_c0_g2_i1.p1  ORF type:complete len:163 (+),score=17.85 TRINITY_DN20840_c0_g2_i1:175-663(+)